MCNSASEWSLQQKHAWLHASIMGVSKDAEICTLHALQARIILCTTTLCIWQLRLLKHKSCMQVCFSTELDSSSYAFGWKSISKTIGGDINIADGSVDLRILIDHSAVAIFTGWGQVRTSR